MGNNIPILPALCVSVHGHLPTAASYGSNMMVSYHPALNPTVTFLISFPSIHTDARRGPVPALSTYYSLVTLTKCWMDTYIKISPSNVLAT